MINYTTPTIRLIVEGKDITANDIRVTIEQGKTELTKKGTDLTVQAVTHGQVTDSEITFVLSQTESGAFDFNRSVSISRGKRRTVMRARYLVQWRTTVQPPGLSQQRQGQSRSPQVIPRAELLQ